MARVEKAIALILGRRKIGEADQQLVLFTWEYGLRRVVAKGVRKIPSRRGGHLEPLTKVAVLLSGHYLTTVETIGRYAPLHANRSALAQAAQVSDLLQRLLPEGQPTGKLFIMIDEAWSLWPKLTAARRAILEATICLSILQETGLAPALGKCLSCGRIQPEEAVVLRGDSGGWQCLSCYGSWAGARHSLSPLAFRALRWLHQHPEQALCLKSSLAEAEQLLQATRHYTAAVAYG